MTLLVSAFPYRTRFNSATWTATWTASSNSNGMAPVRSATGREKSLSSSSSAPRPALNTFSVAVGGNAYLCRSLPRHAKVSQRMYLRSRSRKQVTMASGQARVVDMTGMSQKLGQPSRGRRKSRDAQKVPSSPYLEYAQLFVKRGNSPTLSYKF